MEWTYRNIEEHGSAELKTIVEYILKGDFTKEITIKEEENHGEIKKQKAMDSVS